MSNAQGSILDFSAIGDGLAVGVELLGLGVAELDGLAAWGSDDWHPASTVNTHSEKAIEKIRITSLIVYEEYSRFSFAGELIFWEAWCPACTRTRDCGRFVSHGKGRNLLFQLIGLDRWHRSGTTQPRC